METGKQGDQKVFTRYAPIFFSENILRALKTMVKKRVGGNGLRFHDEIVRVSYEEWFEGLKTK